MSSSPFVGSPKTPQRFTSGGATQLTPETQREEDLSPSSTLSFSAGNSASCIDSSRSFLRNLSATPVRKPLVRSDPTLLTCFDPADKELYDLWAPKQ